MAARKAPLDKDRVVDTALELLDASGFDALTMRALAQALGVQNPALYWHFKDKAEIVNLMAARMLEGSVVTARAREPWDRFLARAARAFRRVMLSRRDGARVVASANLEHSATTDTVHRAVALLVENGFRPRDALTGVVTLFDYVLGSTYERQEDPVRGKKPAVTTEPGPLHAALRHFTEDSAFEGGVRLILDGLAARQSARVRRRRGAR